MRCYLRPGLTLLLATCAVLAASSASFVWSAGDQTVYLPLLNRSSYDLNVDIATYLGGTAADDLRAVDIGPDGGLIAGGVLSAEYVPPGVAAPTLLLGGGEGALIRFDASRRPVSMARIDFIVRDLEIDASGRVVVCGSGGVAVLNPTADAVIWNQDLQDTSRCAIGADGQVAVLQGLKNAAGAVQDSRVSTFSSNGAALGSWSIGVLGVDVAVDSAGQRVIATGNYQKTPDLKVAFLKAWPLAGGDLLWTSYDFPADAINRAGLGADTLGERVAIGRDGLLYFVGFVNGGTGASIFGRDPKELATRLGPDREITTDSYNTPFNVGSVRTTWFGRYNLADGALIKGQSLLTRRSAGQGGSISARSIAADATGQVYLAGDMACCVPNRDLLALNGVRVGEYELGEPFLLAVSPDFTKRIIWTTPAGPAPGKAGSSPAYAISARDGVVAVVGTLARPAAGSPPRSLITFRAIQPAPAGANEGYLLVWTAR